MMSISDECVLYHHIKISIDFWYRWELNPKSFIQSLEILSVELTLQSMLSFI